MTSPAKAKLDALGIDAICDKIVDGKSLTAIAKNADVSIGTLLGWIEDESERSARAKEARALSARIWDDKATEGIEAASDPFELSKAKEMAHHYRWRASKIAPRDYGDKLTQEHTGPNGGPMQVAINYNRWRPIRRSRRTP
jgi:hypothetical protein